MKKTMIPVRYMLAFIMFLLTVLLYVDRACISTAKDYIIKDLNFSMTDYGWIMAVFTLGYALFQTPAGKMADIKGPRIVLTFIISIWSALTALTGVAWNFISMLIIRFFFGAGEAGAFPSLSKIVYNWFPVRERGIIQGINFSGSRIGAALGLPLVALLMESLGWRHTFAFFGGLGILFALAWYFLFRDHPHDSKFVREEEKLYIERTRQKSENNVKVLLPFGKIIRSGNMWLAMIQYICSNFTFYFTLTWMYPYIKEKFLLGSVEAGLYASLPLIGGACGNWISGFIVDYIYNRKGQLGLSRRFPALVGFALAAIGMVMVTKAETSSMSIIYMSLAVFGADMTLSPSWAFCIDIGKDNSGLVSGTMNMAGNLGAFVTIIAYPYLFEWFGTHVPFFYTCSALSLIAMLTWMFMKPEKYIK